MKNKYIGYLALLPFAIVVFLYEILPLLQLVYSSLIGKESETFGLENFIKIFTTPLYTQAIVNSIKISLISAIVGIIVAFIAARYATEASPHAQRTFTMLLNMTSNFSGVPLAFAFMVLMGNTGVFSTICRSYGIPLLENFDLYSGQGLMLLYIYFQIPLSTLLLIPAFAGIHPEWRQAAMLLNAKPADYWFRIVVPNLMPSILGTLSVLFANALVSNNYALLALQITSKYKGDVEIDRATGGALAVVLILLMIAATLINNYFTKRNLKGRDLV